MKKESTQPAKPIDAKEIGLTPENIAIAFTPDGMILICNKDTRAVFVVSNVKPFKFDIPIPYHSVKFGKKVMEKLSDYEQRKEKKE